MPFEIIFKVTYDLFSNSTLKVSALACSWPLSIAGKWSPADYSFAGVLDQTAAIRLSAVVDNGVASARGKAKRAQYSTGIRRDSPWNLTRSR